MRFTGLCARSIDNYLRAGPLAAVVLSAVHCTAGGLDVLQLVQLAGEAGAFEVSTARTGQDLDRQHSAFRCPPQTKLRLPLVLAQEARGAGAGAAGWSALLEAGLPTVLNGVARPAMATEAAVRPLSSADLSPSFRRPFAVIFAALSPSLCRLYTVLSPSFSLFCHCPRRPCQQDSYTCRHGMRSIAGTSAQPEPKCAARTRTPL